MRLAVGNRRQIAQRAVDAHVVVAEHIVVEGALQLLQLAEGAASHELRLEYAVGCLGHRVVVGAALAPAAERPLDLPCTVAVPAAAQDPWPACRICIAPPSVPWITEYIWVPSSPFLPLFYLLSDFLWCSLV